MSKKKNLLSFYYDEKSFLTTKTLIKTLHNQLTKILQKSGIQKNEVIELIYRGFI